MSEVIKNGHGEVLNCDFCSVGAAVHRLGVEDWERRFAGDADTDAEDKSYLLCELCYQGSVTARSVLVYGRDSDEARMERLVARMLNAFRGSTGE